MGSISVISAFTVIRRVLAVGWLWAAGQGKEFGASAGDVNPAAEWPGTLGAAVFAPNGNVSAEIGVLVALFIAIAEKNAGVGALIVVHVNCLLLRNLCTS